jgi:hypothetical protein
MSWERSDGAITMRTTPGQFLQQTMGHWINLAVDLMPRRAAFLHEARVQGYKTLESLQPLLKAAREGDQNALHTVEMIGRRANDAIVDYERMSPFEREVLTRWIFFYPWIKGATRYSSRFIAEHPMQAMALAMAVDHLQAAQQNQLGPGPLYTQMEVPVSTESIGLKVPGTGIDVGLDQLVGKHRMIGTGGNPEVIDFRQALTQTTPAELLQAGIAFVTGHNAAAAAELVQHLTPVPYAIGVSMYGYDPYKHSEVKPGLSAFLGQLGPQQTPLWSRYTLLNMSPSERRAYQQHALHPRSQGDEWARLFGGALAPAPENVAIRNARAQQEQLANAPLFERRKFLLEQNSQKVGMGDLPPEALDDLRWKTQLDHSIHKGATAIERATAAAKVYDARYGTTFSKDVIPSIKTEGDAETFYRQLRSRLYPYYAQWSRRVNHLLSKSKQAEPVPAG